MMNTTLDELAQHQAAANAQRALIIDDYLALANAGSGPDMEYTISDKPVVDMVARITELEIDRNHWHAEAMRWEGHYDKLVARYNQLFELPRQLDGRMAKRLLDALPTFMDKERQALEKYIQSFKEFFGETA